MAQESLTKTARTGILVANRYRLIERVGAGGMSIVFKAEDRLTRDVVALKQMRIDTRELQQPEQNRTSSGDALALALEFRALAGLRHPYIVPVLDYGLDDEHRPFLTMALIEDAQTLIEAARSLPQDGKVALLVQLLNALMYLHRRGIIHHDIKPANILVGRDGVARVLDFGLAVNTTLSMPAGIGGLSGTIAYLAPELFREPTATIQADLFAVGVMAYEMFTGRYPFESENSAMLMYSILQSYPDMSMLDPPLANVLEQLLAKEPGNRYQSAREVIRDICLATGYPEPLESRSLRDSYLQASEFVGRRGELATLKSALGRILPDETSPAGAATPTGSAWLIGGESGVGKSRLIDEIRIRAVVRGAQVLQGQTMTDGGQTYQVWRDPMRHLALSTNITAKDASVLKEIIPDIDSILGYEIPEPPLLEGRDHRERLISSIITTFQEQPNPMVLILEDLHGAVESLEPLKILLNHVRDLPLVIIGSYRHDELPDLPDLLPAMTLMKLDRLKDDEIADLSASILGRAGRQPALLELLKRETEGNPFFIVEVLRALADASGRLADIGQVAIPDRVFAGGVIEVIRRRLELVPDWARPMLQLAAVAGRELDLTVLETIYHHQPDYVLADRFRLDHWLTFCSDIAVLEIPSGAWRFSHEKIRDLVLESLDPAQWVVMNCLLAETIEQVYPDDMSRAETLMEHWHQANDIDRELPYLLATIEWYIDTASEPETARKLLQRGLDRLPEDDPRRNMLLVYLSQSYLRIDYARGEELGLIALRQSEKHQDVRATAQVLYVLSLHVREQMRYEEAEAYSRRSLELFQSLGDDRGSANNLVSLGIIAHDHSQYERARNCYERALAIYHRLGDEGRIAVLEILIGTLSRDDKRYDEAIERIERGLQIARRIGMLSAMSHALNNLGVTATEQREYEKARAYLTESLAVYRSIGNQWGVTNGHINLGFVHLELGDHLAARSSLEEGVRRAMAISARNLALEGIVGFACLAEREGDYQLSARLIGMAEPLANIDVGHRITPLLGRLEQQMPAEQLEAARQQGKGLALEVVVERLLGMMG
jgi:serine/threonine protein kinase/tetratricopeptide (TPR) repeat protein